MEAADPHLKKLKTAIAFHQQGKLSEAKQLYEEILSKTQNHFDALHLSAIIAFQSDKYAEAEQLFIEAATLHSNFAPLYLNFGLLRSNQKRYHESYKCFEKAIQIKPDYDEAFMQRGLVLQHLQKDEEAISSFEQVIFIKPENSDAYFHRASSLMQKNRIDESISSYEIAILLTPKTLGYYKKYGFDFQKRYLFDRAIEIYDRAILQQVCDRILYYNRGRALQDLNRIDEALKNYDEAISHDPTDSASYYSRAIALNALGRVEEALQSYDTAIHNDASFFEAYLNRGVIEKELRLFKEALSSFGDAILLKPDDASAFNNRGSILLELRQYDAAISDLNRAIRINPEYGEAYNNRGNVFKDLGFFTEALADYKAAKELKVNYVGAWSNYLFTMNYIDQIDEHVRIEEARKFGEVLTLLVREKIDLRRPYHSKPLLRIGFVSADFMNHPVGYFLKSLLLEATKLHLELIAYSNNPYEDDLTNEFQMHFHKFRKIFDLNDSNAANLILSDEIDILIDMAGHTSGNRLTLFVLKPAPVQVSWLGYFATTGVAEIDYILGDKYVTPTYEEHQFTERIKRLPETYFCFTPPSILTEIEELPALRNGYVTFGCFNNFSKVNEAVVAVWAEILGAVEKSRLFLKAAQFKDHNFVEKTKNQFHHFGVLPEQLCFEGPTNRTAYFNAYNKIDIALDPFPYPGGTTSVEGLWMGVPVITKKGNRFISHNGETIAHNCGQQDWIANDNKEYIEKAVRFSSDLQGLANLRSGLRAQVLASPLFDAKRFARNFEKVMFEIWEEYKIAQQKC